MRQREFCRLYASGLPATEAAIRAGYARSTAETNAHRLLCHPLVRVYVIRIKEGQASIHPAELRQAAERAMHIIYNSSEDSVALRAIEQVRRLAIAKVNTANLYPIPLPSDLLPGEREDEKIDERYEVKDPGQEKWQQWRKEEEQEVAYLLDKVDPTPEEAPTSFAQATAQCSPKGLHAPRQDATELEEAHSMPRRTPDFFVVLESTQSNTIQMQLPEKQPTHALSENVEQLIPIPS